MGDNVNVVKCLLIIVSLFLVGLIPLPDPDPECVGEYNLLWVFPDCKYCSEQTPRGTYYLFTCPIVRPSGVQTIKFVSNCVYAKGLEIDPPDSQSIHLPLIMKPYKTIIGEALLPPGDN